MLTFDSKDFFNVVRELKIVDKVWIPIRRISEYHKKYKINKIKGIIILKKNNKLVRRMLNDKLK